jgi:outer membrane protein insertion porin family
MFPWGEEYTKRLTCIADRFFLGGPSSLRGFKFKGIGASDVRRPSTASNSAPQSTKVDALGGDLYTSVMAAVGALLLL